jgi:hypothetical protein
MLEPNATGEHIFSPTNSPAFPPRLRHFFSFHGAGFAARLCARLILFILFFPFPL